MRITILNQFYKPDLAPTGHLAASLAEHRAGQGDTVTVITSLGGYVKSSPVAASDEGDGNLRVIRLWTPRLGKNRGLFRIIDYSSFYIQAALRTLFLPPQDVIVSLTTPPFIAWAGALHKRIHGSTKLVLWNMDSYPEILERTGVMKEGSLPSRFLRALNEALFRRLDYLVCLDDAMCHLLTRSYLPEESQLPSTVIPNWETMSLFSGPQPQDHIPDSLELDLEDKFVILYLGNAGFGHSFETVLEAAIRLKENQVLFLFVGGGKKWPLLEEQKDQRGLDNLLLHPYVPKEATPAVMALADCALITLNRPALGVISPSKLHSNLAMGLPIIYVGPEGGNVDEAIASFNCGTSLRHGDVDRLVDFVESLIVDQALLETYRRNARRAFDEAYNDRVTLPKFDQIIAALGTSGD
jgi:glycosyltransferase involved in cell wall biosynthesis